MVQGVREVFELTDDSNNTSSGGEKRDPGANKGKIVIIGRGLDEQLWQRSLDYALV